MKNYSITTNTHNPWQNLAVEAYLATLIKQGDVILYLWQNQHTVVIGRNQNALRECKAQQLEEDGGFLARRTTGGGAVYHDLGNLNFTFLASPERYDLEKQLLVVEKACEKFGIKTRFSGRNDIVTEDGYKFSGNAFSFDKQCRIQHGTIMLDVDVEKLGKYLTPSVKKMESKGVKSVRSRVCSLKKYNSSITVGGMENALTEAFLELYGEYETLPTAMLENEKVRGIYDKYSSWEWRYGASPACEITHTKQFEWGGVEVQMKLDQMLIEEINIFSDMMNAKLPPKVTEYLKGKRYDMQDVEVEKSGDIFTTEEKVQVVEIVEWLRTVFTEN